MIRPLRAVADIDLDAITANVRRLHEIAGVPVMTVVKADAYGHGLIPVATAAIAGGATWLGVALIDEALALRAGGVANARILAWLSPPEDRFAEAINADIDLSVGSVDSVLEIAAIARALGVQARVHLEVDTGMTRGGVRHDLDRVLAALVDSRDALDLVGIWSHLASADQPQAEQNASQRVRFEEAIAAARAAGLNPQIRHLANSAATLSAPELRYDLVRCGIVTYGLSPDLALMGPAEQWGLRPAMRLSARLTLVKDVEAGAVVSYGATHTLSRAAKIAIIPLGYADGIPRHGSGRLEVESREGRHPLRGRVCMDQVIMECAPDSGLRAGDEVVLFGPGGPSADEWGSWAGTIGYEIVTRLGPRVERRYHRSPGDQPLT